MTCSLLSLAKSDSAQAQSSVTKVARIFTVFGVFWAPSTKYSEGILKDLMSLVLSVFSSAVSQGLLMGPEVSSFEIYLYALMPVLMTLHSKQSWITRQSYSNGTNKQPTCAAAMSRYFLHQTQNNIPLSNTFNKYTQLWPCDHSASKLFKT
jgi:hypothetical protein